MEDEKLLPWWRKGSEQAEAEHAKQTTDAEAALADLDCAEDTLMRMSQPFDHGMPKSHEAWFGYRMRSHAAILRRALQLMIEKNREPTREEKMLSFTTASGNHGWCDPEIFDFVTFLNKNGFDTIASCSGHGFQPPRITLRDGRELLIVNYEQATQIGGMFTDINGETK